MRAEAETKRRREEGERNGEERVVRGWSPYCSHV